jgi:protoporphyrin/coproporphyrin ferrochelatase
MKNKTCFLIINLGSPDNPTPFAVAKFLYQFLTDKRVIRMNMFVWRIILLFFILPIRSFVVAKKYQNIWGKKSSILTLYGRSIAEKLNNKNIKTYYAATYGKPAIYDTLQQIKKYKYKKIILLPMFAQYSTTTTEAVFDAITKNIKKINYQPAIKYIKSYYKHHSYTKNIQMSIDAHLKINKDCEHLIFSFHSVPVSYNEKKYLKQVTKTYEAISANLPIKTSLCFQSRAGFTTWQQPYTDKILIKLAKQNIKKVAIIAPGFAVDCLETKEEIQIEFQNIFIKAGGDELTYIPALNDSVAQIELFKKLYDENNS